MRKASAICALSLMLWVDSGFATQCDPFPCSTNPPGGIWYSDPGGVPGTRDGLTHPGNNDTYIPILTNGHRVGVSAVGLTAGNTYQLLDVYGASSSQALVNGTTRAITGAIYDFSSVATPVVPAGQLHQVSFPDYVTGFGVTVGGYLSEGPSHFEDVISRVGPNGFTLTTSTDQSLPGVVHFHYVAANGTVSDYDVTPVLPYHSVYNMHLFTGPMNVNGVSYRLASGSFSIDMIALDMGVNQSLTVSYIISHQVDTATGQNYWRLNKAVQVL